MKPKSPRKSNLKKDKLPPNPNLIVTVELVDVAKAKEYLALNLRNRPISKTHVAKLSSMMASDSFFPGTVIRFDTDGILMDSQHRLESIVVTGKPQWFVVIRNVDKAFWPIIDGQCHKKRSFSDNIIRNFGSKVLFPNESATVVSMFFGLKRHGELKSVHVSNIAHYAGFMELNRLLLEKSLVLARKAAKHAPGFGGSVLGALGYLYSTKYDTQWSAFLNMFSGSMVPEGHPVLYLLINRDKIASLPVPQRAIMIARAFELHLSGRKVKSFTADKLPPYGS